MSYYFQPSPPVMARMVIDYGNGTIVSYDLGLWSPGWRFESKAESVRRVKPRDLVNNLTPLGTHSRQVATRQPQSWVEPMWGGGETRYIDIDPQTYVTCGPVGVNPEPDWQTKLRLAIKDQKVNLAQTLAEYSQAQKMFASNATTIANVLRSLRKGDMPGVFKTLGIPRKQLRGTISNRWLELQYGWMPLLSDLHGSVEELQAGLARPRTRKINVRVSESTEGVLPNYWAPWAKKYSEIIGTNKTVVKVVVYLRQESLAASRLGITNPVNLAWELLPYSFVIDWFIPIGNWLNSLDAGIGFNGLNGTVTTKTKSIATNQLSGAYYMQQEYSRRVITDIPSAPLPTWKPSLGWKQVTNALALLSQLKR